MSHQLGSLFGQGCVVTFIFFPDCYRLLRGNQAYSFPIHLCDQVLPSPIFYGTVTPLVGMVIIRRLIVEPYMKQQKSKDIERHRAMHQAQ